MKKLLLITMACLSLLTVRGQENALSFDGLDDRVACGNASNVQLSGNQISLEAWIYPVAWRLNVWEGNIVNKESNQPDYGYMLRCGNAGRLNFNLGNGTSWTEVSSLAGVLSLNTWQHVAGTYDGTTMRIYVNGVQIDSLTTTISFSSASGDLTIGNWSDPAFNRTFNGIIDEVRVWNRWRSGADILASMNQEFCTTPAGLVAYYSLNDGIAGGNNLSNTTAIDKSGNGNNGTLSGFALSGALSNWVNGTVTAAVDTGLSINGTTITCNANNATYLWLDCNQSMSVVPGQIWQSFTPSKNGSYAARISQNGCTDTTRCAIISSVSTNHPESSSELAIYPNPSTGSVSIRLGALANKAGRIIICDVAGRVRTSLPFAGNHMEVQLSLHGLDAGVYNCVIQTDERVVSRRLTLLDRS